MLPDSWSKLSTFVFSSGFALWLILTLLLSTSLTLAQETERRLIPDGTMGEYLEPIDSIEKKKFLKHRIIFTGRFSSLRVGMGFLYEYAAYFQDAAAKQQMDSAGIAVENQFKPRDFRIMANGQFTTKRVITWKIGLMYDGPTREWFIRETGITIAVPEISGHIFVGRTKEGYSLNKVMNGYAGWTMERQMALDVIPILADGIKWIGFWPKRKIIWNVGIYDDYFSRGQGFSTYSWQTAARVGWLPIFLPEEKKQLHLGLSYRYGKVENGVMRMKSRPESNPAPFFIDTENFDTDHSNHVGTEVYYTRGPLMIGSEYHWHKFSSPEKGNPLFHGGDIAVSYIFTGGSRPYSTTSGVYSFVPVKNPVFKGGWGEVEGLVRASSLDLDAGGLRGGKLWRITPMINWYLSRSMRLEFAYGYAVLNRFNLKGATQFFHARIQIAIL